MNPNLEAELLAASQPLRVPGTGPLRILTPEGVERVAAQHAMPRRLVEAAALEAGVSPLHYLRNLSELKADGQARLLRSTIAVAGQGVVVERALDLLAQKGVGRFLLRPTEPEGEVAGRLCRAVLNRNASCEVDVSPLSLREGNPTQSVAGAQVVAACLDDAADEQLLQFACRVVKAPLVLAGADGQRGQATTVRPGDPGAALIYKPTHPHLESRRHNAAVDPRAALMVGAWMAEQVLNLLLDTGEILAGRLLYADLDTAEMDEYPF